MAYKTSFPSAISPIYRGGTSEKGQFVLPFCTFWTRVAITAPRRPKRTKPGSKAVWVLGNQPVAGFARRFGRLARQHVRCGANMCPFQGQKSALGGRSYIWSTSHDSQPIFARKRCFRSRTKGLCEGFREKTRCGEMATKTAIWGGFRRVGEIWVAAEDHFGSVKRRLRAGALGRSVVMGLLRAPVMPKQASLASEAILGPCRCNVAEIHVFDPSSRQAL